MNGDKILVAYKENLSNRLNLIGKEKEIQNQYLEITQLIDDVRKIYLVAFKNIGTDKEVVCKVEDIFNKRKQYYYRDIEDEKIKEVWLFLNKEGFSITRGIPKDQEKVEDLLTRHIHREGDEKDFIRALLRLSEHKDEIWAKIKMPIKKERFRKFVSLFESNRLNLILDKYEDYNYFEQLLNKEISFYDNDKISTLKIDEMFIETNNPHNINTKTKKIKQEEDDYDSSRYMKGNLYLNEMEKIEQIYDEIVIWFDGVIKRQEELLLCMRKFKDDLVDGFAKELIISQMDKEAKEDSRRK